MKIAAAADFHGKLPSPDSVPDCDVLILAGDYGVGLTQLERWIEQVPAKHVVGIGGNADFSLSNVLVPPAWYLEDGECVIEGVTFYGAPWTPDYFKQTFQLPEEELAKKWERIPEDVQVLITHGPPRGILDRTWMGAAGSQSLRAALDSVRFPELRLHVFGHIHEQAGNSAVVGNVLYVNVARQNGSLKPMTMFIDF